MRINQYVAHSTSISRRKADEAVTAGRVRINGELAAAGTQVAAGDQVTLDDHVITPAVKTISVILNKPVGYVCSRNGQGSQTIYDLLPPKYRLLNIAGRLDKDSSGLVILTDDGELLNMLAHPSFNKNKVYELTLDKPLNQEDHHRITGSGVDIGDSRPSRFALTKQSDTTYLAVLTEGRNRQIRRTFARLGYQITRLHRTVLGNYNLDNLKTGEYLEVTESHS